MAVLWFLQFRDFALIQYPYGICLKITVIPLESTSQDWPGLCGEDFGLRLPPWPDRFVRLFAVMLAALFSVCRLLRHS